MRKQDVLLDTSVIIRLDGKKTGKIVREQLEAVFRKEESTAYVSVMTCYEYTRTAKDYNEIKRKAAFLQQWDYLDIDRAVMKIATIYYNVLSKLRNVDDGRLSLPHIKTQFSDADIIIGATALQHDLQIATFDAHDFPRPLFEEQHIFPMGGEKLYILKPDAARFEKYVTDLYKEMPKKRL